MPGTNGAWELMIDSGSGDGGGGKVYLGTLGNDLYFAGSSGESADGMQGIWRLEDDTFVEVTDLEGIYTNTNFNGLLGFGALGFNGKLYIGDRSGGRLWRLDLNRDGTFSALTQAAAIGGEDIFMGPIWAGKIWAGTFGTGGPPSLNPELWTYDGENAERLLDFENCGTFGQVDSLTLFDDHIWVTVRSEDWTVNEIWKVNAAGAAELVSTSDTVISWLGAWKGDLYQLRGEDQADGTASLALWNGSTFDELDDWTTTSGNARSFQGLYPQGDRLLATHYYLGSWYWDGSLHFADGGGAQSDPDGAFLGGGAGTHFGAPLSFKEHDGYLYVVTVQPTKLWRRETTYDDGPHIVLDPGQVATGRASLDISEWVKDPVDWGDAEIQQYMAEQARGSSPVDIRLPNRTVTIPLILKDRTQLTMEQIRRKLQAKTALLQQQRGWVERTLPTGEQVYADVVNATFKLPDSWFQAYRSAEPDAELTLECVPDFYGHEDERTARSGNGTLTWVEGIIDQSDYPTTVLADAPVSYWRLGEPSGTTAADEMGANAGTYVSSPTLGVAGPLVGDSDTAVTFAAGKKMTAADSASLDVGDAFTLECWAKLTAGGFGDWGLFEKGTNAFSLFFTGGKIRLAKGGVANVVDSSVNVTDTGWHHIVCTKNGGTVKLYVDGADVTGTVTNSTMANTATELTVANGLAGTMDEAAIYNFALTAAQVSAHYTAGSTAPVGQSVDPIEGDYPGRLRLKITEGSGNDQLGLIAGLRCKHYDAAETAALFYEAEDLTPLDAATVETLSGASGGSAIRHNNLGSNWTPVHSTLIDGVGEMTQTGTYRPRVRVYTTSTTGVKVRLVYDVGDLALPVENPSWTIPSSGNFYLADLGEIRIDPTTGTHRWQGQIQALGEAGGENVYVDTFELVPVDEGYFLGSTSLDSGPGLADYVVRSEFTTESGAITGDSLSGIGGTWAGSGDADDFSASGGAAVRTATGDTSSFPRGRFVVATPTLAATVVQADFESTNLFETNAMYLGVTARFTNTSNFFMAAVQAPGPPVASPGGLFDLVVGAKVGGSGFSGNPTTLDFRKAANDTSFTIRALVDVHGRYFVWVFPARGSTGPPVETGVIADLATGGALDDGKVGLYDENGSVFAATRSYRNFAAWEPSTDAVLFADQQAELSWDGHFRQDSAGVGSGRISETEDGLMRMPPSGMEGRPIEFYLRSSQGDLDQLPDSSASDAVSAQAFVRSSWLFLPGT